MKKQKLNCIGVTITEHAKLRFYDRVAEGQVELPEEHRKKFASETIKEMFAEAVYISDNDKGILFRNHAFGVDLIVKGKSIITLLPLDKRRNARLKTIKRREAELQAESNKDDGSGTE